MCYGSLIYSLTALCMNIINSGHTDTSSLIHQPPPPPSLHPTSMSFCFCCYVVTHWSNQGNLQEHGCCASHYQWMSHCRQWLLHHQQPSVALAPLGWGTGPHEPLPHLWLSIYYFHFGWALCTADVRSLVSQLCRAPQTAFNRPLFLSFSSSCSLFPQSSLSLGRGWYGWGPV